MRERVLLLAEASESHELEEIVSIFAARDCVVDVFDAARVAEDISLLEAKLATIDRVVVLQAGDDTDVILRIVEYVRLMAPVWCIARDSVDPLPGTRRLDVDGLDDDFSAFLTLAGAAESTEEIATPGKLFFGYPRAVVVTSCIALLFAVFVAVFVLDDIAAQRAVTSADLAELDAYLRDWPSGENREAVGRERVSRVVLQIPELGRLSGDGSPPQEDEKAWLDFDEADWSRLPAVVLLRIADEKHGMPAIAAAARAGDGAAAHLMGTAFLFGAFSIEQDQEVARKLFGAACAVGLQRGCFNVGHALSNYSDDPVDHASGFDKFLESCEYGIEIACVNVSVWLEQRGQDVLPGETDENFLREHCEAGSVYLCAWLGRKLYLSSDVGSPVLSDAIRLLEHGCEISDAVACNHLAQAYKIGRGVEKDLKRAFRLFVVSCNGGLAASCGAVSEAYFNGNGTEKNASQMLLYAEKSCTYGGRGGCFRIGYAFSQGQSGLQRDVERAAYYYRQSCAQGSSGACYNLGHYHRDRLFAGAKVEQAAPLFKKACEMGFWQSCSYEAVELAENGQSALAIEKFQMSCENGEHYGCLFLGEALRKGLDGAVDIAGARDAFSRALEINEGWERAQEALDLLDDGPH